MKEPVDLHLILPLAPFLIALKADDFTKVEIMEDGPARSKNIQPETRFPSDWLYRRMSNPCDIGL